MRKGIIFLIFLFLPAICYSEEFMIKTWSSGEHGITIMFYKLTEANDIKIISKDSAFVTFENNEKTCVFNSKFYPLSKDENVQIEIKTINDLAWITCTFMIYENKDNYRNFFFEANGNIRFVYYYTAVEKANLELYK